MSPRDETSSQALIGHSPHLSNCEYSGTKSGVSQLAMLCFEVIAIVKQDCAEDF